MDPSKEKIEALLKAVRMLSTLVILLSATLIFILLAWVFEDSIRKLFNSHPTTKPLAVSESIVTPDEKFWAPPNPDTIKDIAGKAEIEYGKELIAHTARYLGPKGLVMQTTNGMNCQNCHLEAGTRIFGNNYSAVASTYPKFRARSGSVEDIHKRVNDCLERSLNGKPLDTLSREMKAIKAYIVFLGTNVRKGEKPNGAGFKDLVYLDREADPVKGKLVFLTKCVTCHMPDGQGQILADGTEYKYPPLWGQRSYNDGAGLYRIASFAKYVKYNMPFETTFRNPALTDEEAWDVAAFINSQSRPHMNTPNDWPDISKKPVDHPFGPYADSFSEKQHKFGPFQPILEAQKKSSQAIPK